MRETEEEETSSRHLVFDLSPITKVVLSSVTQTGSSFDILCEIPNELQCWAVNTGPAKGCLVMASDNLVYMRFVRVLQLLTLSSRYWFCGVIHALLQAFAALHVQQPVSWNLLILCCETQQTFLQWHP